MPVFSWPINSLYVSLFFGSGHFFFATRSWTIPIRFFGFLLSFKRNNFFISGLHMGGVKVGHPTSPPVSVRSFLCS
jgi:hypothetical protein